MRRSSISSFALLALLSVARPAAGAIPSSERDALLRLYNTTNGGNWSNKTGWLGPAGTECSWAGIQCDGTGVTVRQIWLGGNNLTGSPDIGSLPNLQVLDLSGNSFSGNLPASFFSLPGLTSLNLYGDSFGGPIPAKVGSLAKLQAINLGANALTGPVPPEFGALASLQSLNLAGNQLTGEVPAQLGSATALTTIDLSYNQLSGPIPAELGRLKALQELRLQSNSLSGPIPDGLGSASALQTLDLGSNELTGAAPATLGNLSNLEVLWLGGNRLTSLPLDGISRLLKLKSLGASDNLLTGPLPPGLSALTALTALDLSWNQLSGSIPETFGQLKALQELYLGNNKLSGPIPSGLGGATALQRLDLGGNALTGEVPATLAALSGLVALRLDYNQLTSIPFDSLTKLSRLQSLTASQNQLSGRIPASLSSLKALAALDLSGNQLTGEIPPSLGSLPVLGELDLNGNSLTGAIPPELGNLALLTTLRLGDNQLTGGIPDSFQQLQGLRLLGLWRLGLTGDFPSWIVGLPLLERVYLDGNRLSGSLPAGLGDLANLAELNLSGNQLTGSLPASIGKLARLTDLDLSGNQIAGPLPSEIGTLAALRTFHADGNLLSGSLPSSLGNLPALEELVLQGNLLSGPVPAALGSLPKLRILNLSYNQLSGPIPPELGGLAGLTDLNLRWNGLTGPIPARLGSLAALGSLDLSSNHLSGPIPGEVGNLGKLWGLWLNGNMLSGAVPPQIVKLTGVLDWAFDLSYNALHTDDAAVRAFIDSKQYGFDLSQTVAPIAVNVAVASTTSVTLRWNPILYQGDPGGTLVYLAPGTAGPYALVATVNDKETSSVTIGGLAAGSSLSFVLRSFTRPHDRNPNTVVSDGTDPVPAATKSPGSVNVSLTPASLRIQTGTNGTLTVTIAPSQAAPVAVALLAANATVAGLGSPTVTIAAGATQATVSVAGKQAGTTYVSAQLPAGLGGSSATADVVVDASACERPPTPSFTNPSPATVRSGNSFTFAWTDTLDGDPSGAYQLDVYGTGDCTGTPRRFPTPRPAFTLPTAPGQAATYCAVVRAVSGAGCPSGDSGRFQLSVLAGPPAFVVASTSDVQVTAAVGAPLPTGTVTFKNIGFQAAGLVLRSSRAIFSPAPASVATVAPGGSVDVKVTFDPLAITTASAFLDSLCGTWKDSGVDRTVCAVVSVTALDRPPSPAASATTTLQLGTSNEVHFVAPAGGTPPVQTITVTNAGSAPARIAPGVGPGGAWLGFVGGDLSSPIPPGGSRNLVLAVDRTRRVAGDGPAPVSTYLSLATVDGPAESRSKVIFQVFDEEPGPVTPGSNRPFLGRNDYSLVVPSGVNASGQGAYFLSDGWIRNRSATAATADLYYTPNGADGIGSTAVRKAQITLQPYATYRLADFVRGLFSTVGSGAVEVRSASISDLLVRSTVDSMRVKEGRLVRFGAEVPTVRSREGASLEQTGGAPILLTGIKGGPGSGFRTNVILTETSGHSLLVGLRLVAANGKALRETRVTLLPYSKIQVNTGDDSLFPGDAAYDGSSLAVTPVEGIGSVAAFATVLDNASQAYTTRSGQFTAAGVAAAAPAAAPGVRPKASITRLAIAAVARAAGKNNSFYTTAVSLTNGTASDANVQMRYLADNPDTVPGLQPVAVQVKAGSTVTYKDLLNEAFGVTSTGTAGMVFLEGPDVRMLVVASETSTPLDPADVANGYSPSTLSAYAPQAIQAVGDPGSGLPSTVVSHPALEESSRFRTNLILAEIGGALTTVTVRLVPKDSGGVPLAQKQYTLQPFQRLQINNFMNDVAGGGAEYVDMETDVEWSSQQGRVLAVATKIDNDAGSKRSDVYVLGPSGVLQGSIGF